MSLCFHVGVDGREIEAKLLGDHDRYAAGATPECQP
jgi:hypothetical protein